jgi:hypothetical protein
VFVPKSVAGLFRTMNLVPRSVADFITKILKGDQVLVNPDHMLRGAYEQRTGDQPLPAAAGEPAAASPAPAPEKQAV